MALHSIGSATGTAPDSQHQVVAAPSQAKSGGAVRDSKAIPDQPRVPEASARDPRSLQYQVDGQTHRVIATIVDENSETVVVQIPSEEVLRIAKAIDRLKGFLLDSKA